MKVGANIKIMGERKRIKNAFPPFLFIYGFQMDFNYLVYFLTSKNNSCLKKCLALVRREECYLRKSKKSEMFNNKKLM